jgi:integrating conjugative element protein (TIGR03752 family)
VIVPMGYRMTGGSGHASSTLVRSTLSPDLAATNAATAAPPQNAHLGSQKPQAEPYFTIPENATLARSTAMTTLVGRVPIDGRVQDPMQFKLVVGRENLAASGQYVPDDIAGIVISGIAVGDMALSCTEGLIQSMTFVFDDGTIRTVSQRTGGASVGFGTGGGGGSGGGGVGGQSLASASKLGWLSDEFGNPCIPGKFVTNAPAYLSDVVGAKALSMAGAAVASAQTTTTNGASALGSTSSSTVTGDRGSYVLGKVASAGSDEVVSWLMRRLNNSFDAVVVRAGTRVAVHIDQSIHIDKEPDGRKLDYARGQASLANQKGAHHGMD